MPVTVTFMDAYTVGVYLLYTVTVQTPGFFPVIQPKLSTVAILSSEETHISSLFGEYDGDMVTNEMSLLPTGNDISVFESFISVILYGSSVAVVVVEVVSETGFRVVEEVVVSEAGSVVVVVAVVVIGGMSLLRNSFIDSFPSVET